ncbi:MAG TPA: F0F1 ATP synthase subunit alpha [Candidatus Acidoferrales bacterium]|nr:F0F1 ATP synthase subunit alpha [Candidatus Acidoferrales bacterium]
MTAPDFKDYRFGLRVREQGRVISVGDGISWIAGLPSAALDQLVTFDDGTASRGMLFNLEAERIGAIILDQGENIVAGTRVVPAAPLLEIPVGDGLLGRVVDPLCRPLDGRALERLDAVRPIDIRSPSIAQRDDVHDPLYTGNTIVDTMLPIGRGQRQLLIGDRGLGKTSLAIDTVVEQRDVLCVYVLIGQRRSEITGLVATLADAGALARTVIVVAEADAPAGLQYIAPYAGCAIAEHWMRQGRHALVVYDDLTRHAQAYRSLSLLLRRPPGREAYPGDIFFLHSRLLERATVLTAELGGGSLTALPIVDTQEGEIAAYIPTNLISITDGQTYFSAQLFAAGSLPAIDLTKSVSRIGGAAQEPSVAAEAGRMRLEYLQFLELERFSRLGTRLEPSTAAKIARGRLLREIFKQERLAPRPIVVQFASMIAFNDGLLDVLPLERARSVLAQVADRIGESDLTLTTPRAQWSSALQAWLTKPP